MSDKPSLALFDFDKTITRSDSFRDFLIHTIEPIVLVKGLLALSPIFLKYALKQMTNSEAKEKVFHYFFAKMSVEEFDRKAFQYVDRHLPKLIREKALEKLKWHQKQGHTVIVVSASFEQYLKIWCRVKRVHLLGTQIQIKHGVITGYFHSENCWGPEKVKRIKMFYDLDEYEKIYAYGDSRGDREMLALAHEAYLNWKLIKS